jgi:repressor LexA
MLTDKQRAVLDVIRDHTADHGYPPTVREIGTALGLTSSSTVHSHLAALERAGELVRDPSKPRALKLANAPGQRRGSPSRAREAVATGGVDAADGSVSLPLVGSVAAGAPILAEEHVEGWLRVPGQLTRSGESFLLKIRGESMVNAGILDGDYVVVRSQKDAANGQIAVAMVDDEATCKRFFRRADHIELRPENDQMEPMRFPNVELVGVVTGVMRAL